MISYDVVVPTVGRPSLGRLLDAVLAGPGPQPERIFVVDDRPTGDRADPLALSCIDGRADGGVTVLASGGRGPAAARNAGWRAGTAEWVVFVDDDVEPRPGWRQQLADDLAALSHEVGGSQGRLLVPLPPDRRPTDWERNVAGLETALWATADMAYRRDALAAVGGFDERFRRAYREDADSAARITKAGWQLVRGRRQSAHPVRPAGRWVSVRLQVGNADDVLLRALHGRQWRRVTGAAAGRRWRHLAVTAAGVTAAASLVARRPRAAALAGAAWLAGTAELAWARIAPGPRTRREVATMALTSAAIPAAATGWWAWGWAVLPTRLRARPGTARTPLPPRPDAVLFDRDGTLVVDVPYNGDPTLVVPMRGAQEAIRRLRIAGIPTAVVSNQSGVGRRLVTLEQVHAVNRRIEELLGPLGPWVLCPHGPADGCACRKPAAGLILRAAELLGVPAERVVVIGDIGADMEAAHAAGARAVLVPTPATLSSEVAGATEVARDLSVAVDLLLGEAPVRSEPARSEQ